MDKKIKVIITAVSPSKEGVVIETNVPASLKTGNTKQLRTWVSWDKIGSCLFDDYTESSDVDDRNKEREIN